jgi:hypothetical protein
MKQDKHHSENGEPRRQDHRTPRDHYQEVTDRIIAALETGTPPWRKPWDPDKASGPAMPRNAATGQRYRGINVLTRGMSALAFSSGDPRWPTYKQAEDRGWQARKGERGTTGYFFKRLEVRDDSRPEDDEDAVNAQSRCCAPSACSMTARSTAFRPASCRPLRKRRGARRKPRRSFLPTAALSFGSAVKRRSTRPRRITFRRRRKGPLRQRKDFMGLLFMSSVAGRVQSRG